MNNNTESRILNINIIFPTLSYGTTIAITQELTKIYEDTEEVSVKLKEHDNPKSLGIIKTLENQIVAVKKNLEVLAQAIDKHEKLPFLKIPNNSIDINLCLN